MLNKLARFPFAAAIFLCASLAAHSQANDVSVSVGGAFSPATVFPSCNGVDCVGGQPATANVAYEVAFAHRLLNFDVASLHLEMPADARPEPISGRNSHICYAWRKGEIFAGNDFTFPFGWGRICSLHGKLS